MKLTRNQKHTYASLLVMFAPLPVLKTISILIGGFGSFLSTVLVTAIIASFIVGLTWGLYLFLDSRFTLFNENTFDKSTNIFVRFWKWFNSDDEWEGQ